MSQILGMVVRYPPVPPFQKRSVVTLAWGGGESSLRGGEDLKVFDPERKGLLRKEESCAALGGKKGKRR